MRTRSCFSAVAALAIVTAFAGCSGTQPLQEEDVHNNPPPSDLNAAVLTITETCLTGARLLQAEDWPVFFKTGGHFRLGLPFCIR
jgi:hypothetical protein